MTDRYDWDALPDAVRSAAQAHVGTITTAREVARGQSSDMALVLRGEAGDVFLKGVRGVSPRMRWLRNEAEAGVLAAGLAPRVRFSEDVDADGASWLVTGFEYVEGRPADLSPGSADLALVGRTLARIAALPGGTSPPLATRWASADWWAKLAAEDPSQVEGWDLDELGNWCRATSESVAGDTLVHTDLHEGQFMIEGDSVRVIDWGRPASGASWVDTAFLVIRLIAAGHTAQQAEAWANSLPTWEGCTSDSATSFACYVAGLWSYRSSTAPFVGAGRLSAAAQAYARYRLAR